MKWAKHLMAGYAFLLYVWGLSVVIRSRPRMTAAECNLAGFVGIVVLAMIITLLSKDSSESQDE